MPAHKPSIAILISGRGSNMIAISKACQSNEIKANVKLVVSNNPQAAGLASAQALGIATTDIDHRQFSQRSSFDQALHQKLLDASPDWIVLAGFMRILGEEFINAWQDRIINIHPSLLPLYPGLNTHARAIANGDKEAGATVHLVTAQLDAGPILAQKKVPIYSDDTADKLAARVLAIEHKLYIEVLKQCVTNYEATSRLQ